MKEVLGCLRRADEDFQMISPGDHVAVVFRGQGQPAFALCARALPPLLQASLYPYRRDADHGP